MNCDNVVGGTCWKDAYSWACGEFGISKEYFIEMFCKKVKEDTYRCNYWRDDGDGCYEKWGCMYCRSCIALECEGL